jgi:hypothetical protein
MLVNRVKVGSVIARRASAAPTITSERPTISKMGFATLMPLVRMSRPV